MTIVASKTKTSRDPIISLIFLFEKPKMYTSCELQATSSMGTKEREREEKRMSKKDRANQVSLMHSCVVQGHAWTLDRGAWGPGSLFKEREREKEREKGERGSAVYL